MSEETMNNESPSMSPPEDLPQVEHYTPTPKSKSKPNANPPSNSKGRWFIGIAVGCLVLLCLCCVGGYVILTMTDLSQNFAGLPEPIRSLLAQATPTRLPTPIPPRPGVGPSPATVIAPSTKPPIIAQPSPVASPTTSSGSTALGNPFADAAAKARTAQKYRIESTVTLGSTTSGKFEEVSLMDLKGVVDGKNSQFEIKGGIFGPLGGGGTIEIAQVDGKFYIRGLPLPGATSQQWYVQKDSSMAASTDAFSKPDYFDSFTSGIKAGDVKKIRTETVDGLQCDVYQYDYKSLQNAALVGLLGSAKDKEDFSAVDKSEMLLWLCSDGYVHKFTFDFQAHNTKDPKEKGTLKMSGHMWDFNNPAIKVVAPANAKPFPGQ